MPQAIVVTTDLLRVAAGRRPARCRSTLAAPGALTTVEGAARALAAAPWPEGFAYALAREVDTLVPEPGARYAVRSSATIEDEARVLAAGLFLSRIDVARGEVLEAVRAVLGVRALARGGRLPRAARAGAPTTLGFAVLIHEFIAGEAARRGRIRSRAPGPADDRGADGQGGGARRRRARARIEEAVRALAATHGAVELEWVVADGQRHVPAAAPAASPARMPARAARRWRCRRSIRSPRRRIAT